MRSISIQNRVVSLCLILFFSLLSARAQSLDPKIRRLFEDNFLEVLDRLRVLTNQLYHSSSDLDRARLLIRRAEQLIEVDEILSARSDLESAIACDVLPKAEKFYARFLLADLYKRTGRLSSAAEIYDLILEDDPENVDALLERGKLWLKSEDRMLALNTARKLLIISPENYEAKFLLADVLLELKQNEEALLILNRLINDPNSPAEIRSIAILRLAEHESGLRNYLVARRLLQDLIKMDLKKRVPAEKLIKILDEAEALDNELQAIQKDGRGYSAEFAVRAARFNERWIKRASRDHFSLSTVRVVAFSSSTRIAFKKRPGALYYYSVDDQRPLVVEVEGPTTLRLFTRPVHLEDSKEVSLKIVVEENSRQRAEFFIDRNTQSSEVFFPDLEGILPGIRESLDIDVPSGIHRYKISSIGGTSFILPSSRRVTESDILIGNRSSSSWWAHAHIDFTRRGITDSVDAIESRYRLYGDESRTLKALENIDESHLQFYGWSLIAEVRKALGLTSAMEISRSAALAPYEDTAQSLTLEAINRYIEEGNSSSAIELARNWLKDHINDGEVRRTLAQILLSQPESQSLEAWIEAENAIPFSKEAEKIALSASGKILWDRRLNVIRSAGSEQVDLFRFESSNRFRVIREALLDPIFEENSAQVVSKNQAARVETLLDQPVRFRVKIYAQGFNLIEPQEETTIEILLDGNKIHQFSISNRKLLEIELPEIGSGAHELRIGLVEATKNSKRGTWYAQIQIENIDNGTIIRPSIRLSHFVATSSDGLRINTYAPGIIRLRVRPFAREGKEIAETVEIRLTRTRTGEIKEFSLPLLKKSSKFASLTYDATAKIGEATDLIIILPKIEADEVYTIDARPVSGQLLLLLYDGRNGNGEENFETALMGIRLDSTSSYLRPSTVQDNREYSKIKHWILNPEEKISDRGLFILYGKFGSERASVLDEGIRTSSGGEFIEQGIIYRRALKNRELYLRGLIGERTLLTGRAVLRSEIEATKYKYGIDLSAKLSLFSQSTDNGAAASFRFDGALSHRFQIPNKYLTFKSSLGYYRIEQTLDRISSKERGQISRQVFIPFYNSHPQGLYLQTGVTYIPFTDTLISGQFRVTTNRSLNLSDLDRVRYRFHISHILLEGRLELSSNFAHIFRFRDRDRERSNSTEDLFASANYSWWTDRGRRISIEGGVRLASGFGKRPNIILGIQFDLNRSRKFDQYEPSEIDFEQQRLRSYRERAVERQAY